MAFDECPAAGMGGDALRKSTELTLRWLERCLSVDLKPHQAIFPIVQGGMDAQLRTWSARETIRIAPDARGYAVGGLSVGEDRDLTFRMLEFSVAELPANRPRYFMGLGVPRDLIEAVDRGIDLFDCVLPTRNARNARVFHPQGDLNLRNARHARDVRVINEACDCTTCTSGFSRGYLHHLFKQDEILACILATQHNVRTLIRQCEEMRQAIRAGKWEDYAGSAGLRTGVVANRASTEPGGPRGWHSRGYMPHFDSSDVIQHVTFHLADSLPRTVLDAMASELEAFDPDKREVERRRRLESFLDAGHGECWLNREACASIVEDALMHFDGERYRLIAWVIMPNHVHVLFQTMAGCQMGEVISSWKTFTANQIGELVKQPGEPLPKVWHREYWDRYIRDEKHLSAVVAYIHENPVKAKLAARAEDWRWSSAWGGRAGAEPGGPGKVG
jgi:REP element-mobilizing transposase RayT